MASAASETTSALQQRVEDLNMRPKIKVQDKRLFICHGQMLDIEPVGFEVSRDSDLVANGEMLRVLYSRTNDKFFQLQESISECSTLIDD